VKKSLFIMLGVAAVALETGCAGPAWFKHFEVERVAQVQKGMSREQVASIVGPPQTVTRLMPNKLHAAEVWRYPNNTSGWLLPNVEMLAVSFDAGGSAVGVIHTKTNN
jgi:outer membrane protein assembly factor BamE (lipoprotein component of BamABCDE complex)